MHYYEDEILSELNVNENYSEKQLYIFIIENRDSVVISKSCSQFSEHSGTKRKVIQAIEGYEHLSGSNYGYNIPHERKRIYIVD